MPSLDRDNLMDIGDPWSGFVSPNTTNNAASMEGESGLEWMKLFGRIPSPQQSPDRKLPSPRQDADHVSYGAHPQATSPKPALLVAPEEDAYGNWEEFPQDIMMPKCVAEATAAVRPARQYEEWARFDDPLVDPGIKNRDLGRSPTSFFDNGVDPFTSTPKRDPKGNCAYGYSFQLSSDDGDDDTDGRGPAGVNLWHTGRRPIKGQPMGNDFTPATSDDVLMIMAAIQESRSQSRHQCNEAAAEPHACLLDFTPKHRSAKVVSFQANIRSHTRRLLKLESIDPVTQQPIPFPFANPASVECFTRTSRKEDRPSVDKFLVDIGSLKSPWNKRLSRIFARDFVNCRLYGCTLDDLESISSAFLTHLKTVRLRAIESQEEDLGQDKLDEEKARARSMRQRNLMNCRMNACEVYARYDPGIKACLDLLKTLPSSVHSEDETAHDGGKNRYAITTMSWRNPAVHYFFRTLDRLHLSTRFTGDHRATRGAFPHIRIPSKRINHDPVVKGLPENFYDPFYLQGLDEFQLAELNIRDAVEVYFSNGIIRLAEKYSRVTNRKTAPLPDNDASLANLPPRLYPLNPRTD